METREFHIGDILSITTEILVSPRGMEGVRDILGFMTGTQITEKTFSLALVETGSTCKPILLDQHPQLGSESSMKQLAVLRRDLDRDISGMPKEDIIATWLEEIKLQFGQTLPVKSIR